jgi:hypothetical protein
MPPFSPSADCSVPRKECGSQLCIDRGKGDGYPVVIIDNTARCGCGDNPAQKQRNWYDSVQNVNANVTTRVLTTVPQTGSYSLTLYELCTIPDTTAGNATLLCSYVDPIAGPQTQSISLSLSGAGQAQNGFSINCLAGSLVSWTVTESSIWGTALASCAIALGQEACIGA